MSELTDRIDELLEKKGLKRADLCRGTGINESTIRNWIRGTAPQVEPIYKIAKFLDVSMEWLVAGTAPDSLSPEEKELLRKWHVLDCRDKCTALRCLDAVISGYSCIVGG